MTYLILFIINYFSFRLAVGRSTSYSDVAFRALISLIPVVPAFGCIMYFLSNNTTKPPKLL